MSVVSAERLAPAGDLTLAERVASVTWYQSQRLPGGVLTPGNFATLDELDRIPFPASLEGKRCLDVATADGFWAFEMERRGAKEVLAIDVRPERLDWPGAKVVSIEPRRRTRELRGFDIAHEALHSQVRWRELSVYELAPALVGEFDFVFMGSVLMHLRDPAAALAAIARVLQGELLSVDGISPLLTLLHPRRPVAQLEGRGWPSWWMPNLQAYRRLFEAGGLELLATGHPFFVKRRAAYSGAYNTTSPRARRSPPQWLKEQALSCLGNLHSWVRASAT